MWRDDSQTVDAACGTHQCLSSHLANGQAQAVIYLTGLLEVFISESVFVCQTLAYCIVVCCNGAKKM